VEGSSPSLLSPLRFVEHVDEKGNFKWLFMKDQCRHCGDPPCRNNCPVEGVIVKDESGGVYYNVERCGECNLECVKYCPFGVPRNKDNERRAFKCRFCIDRVKKGDKPLCVKTCVTGALDFGDKSKMLEKADERIEKLKDKYPDINLYPGRNYNVIWILPYKPEVYGLKSLEEIEKKSSALRRKETLKRDYAKSEILKWLGFSWIAGALGWIVERRTNLMRNGK
jgi:formate dehydrogenase iron-sulfur subunit